MDKSLTITLDETLIAHARQHAEHEGKSTDELIAQLIVLYGHGFQNHPEWARAWSNSLWWCDAYTFGGTLEDSSHSYTHPFEVKEYSGSAESSNALHYMYPQFSSNRTTSISRLVELLKVNTKLRVFISSEKEPTSKASAADYCHRFSKKRLYSLKNENGWLISNWCLPGTSAVEINDPYAMSTPHSDWSLWADLFAAQEKSETSKIETVNNEADSQPISSFFRGEGTEVPASEKPKIDLVSLLRECDAKGISAAKALKELGKEGRITKTFAEAGSNDAKDDEEILGKHLAERYR